MDLQDFIKTTLAGIYNGLVETNKEIVGPELGNTKSALFVISSHDKDSLIEFDVALTAESGSSTKGGGSIKVYVADIGSGKEKTSSEQTVSRIKFRIKAHTTLA